MFSWSNKSLGKYGVVKRFQPQPKLLCVDFTFCSNQEVHIHVKVLSKVNTFYMLPIQRFSIEWKDYVRNWMKLKNNNGMWSFTADKEHTPLIIFVRKQWLPDFLSQTFSSRVCHQGAYRFGSPVLSCSFVKLHFEVIEVITFYKFYTKLIPIPTKSSIICSRNVTMKLYV